MQLGLIEFFYRLSPKSNRIQYCDRLGLPAAFAKIDLNTYETDARNIVNELNKFKDGINSYPYSKNFQKLTLFSSEQTQVYVSLPIKKN
jgi:hypothetical protein